MKDMVQCIVQRLSLGEDLVLATLLSRSSAGPRAAGTHMLVRPDGTILAGTVGGGQLEALALAAAVQVAHDRRGVVRQLAVAGQDVAGTEAICAGPAEILFEWLDGSDPSRLEIYRELLATLEARQRAWLLTALPAGGADGIAPTNCLLKEDGKSLGTVPAGVAVGVGKGSPIGLFGDNLDGTNDLLDLTSTRHPVIVPCGQLRLLIEPVCSPGTVAVFGAGHVSQKLVPLCGLVGFETAIVDDRADFASRERFGTADQILLLESFDSAFADLDVDRETYVVIATRGHEHDLTVLAQALRTDACYIGMLGSRAKREAFFQALTSQGFTAQNLARVHSPVGLNIGAETPEEIAVSIVAELIQARAKRE